MALNKPGLEKASKGFTLIEMLIAVAIIAIVASVALPYFGEASMRGKRVEGKELLLSAAAKQEQFFGQYVSYTTKAQSTSLSCEGVDCGLGLPRIVSATHKYQLFIETGPTGCEPGTANPCRTFILMAAPNGDYKDPDCKALTYTNTGKKGVLDETDTAAINKCWK